MADLVCNVNPRLVALLLSRVLMLNFFYLIFFTILAQFVFESDANSFFYLAAFCLGLSSLLFLAGRNTDFNQLTFREAIGITVFSWLFIPPMSAFIYVHTGNIPDVVDALFESYSGFTTTGSSILTDIEKLDKIVLLWRSFTHFSGGAGIIIMTLLLLPGFMQSGGQLFQAEGGSMIGERHLPSFSQTAKRIASVYVILNGVLILLLLAGGMNLFESVCHAFGTLATGGFSPLGNSIGTYAKNGGNALYFEIVLVIFMLLGATPLYAHSQLAAGRFRTVFSNPQIRFFLKLWAVCVIGVAAILFFAGHYNAPAALRHSLFAVTSLISTTGFATEEFATWPLVTHVIILLAMFIGGCVGSTSGGLKALRAQIIIKDMKNAMRRVMHPFAVYSLRLKDMALNREETGSAKTYVLFFLTTFFTGTAIIALDVKDLETSASAVITAMSGVGPGTTASIGGLGNFAGFSHFSKITMCILMVLGRLEILPLVAIFMKRFWLK